MINLRSSKGLLLLLALLMLNQSVINAQAKRTFTFNGNVFQTYTAPARGWHFVEVRGAQGGNASDNSHVGGKGARRQIWILLEAGEQLRISVGGAGKSGGGSGKVSGGGGGGASSIVKVSGSTYIPIIVCGGGGGAGKDYDGGHATLGSFGGNSTGVNIAQGGGSGSGGGIGPDLRGGAGGGGFYGGGGTHYNSGGSTVLAQGGSAYVVNNFGGASTNSGGDGGWGGGGEGGPSNSFVHGGGGGGGGYSGGAGADNIGGGGGGGSYAISPGSNYNYNGCLRDAAFHTGDGWVTVERMIFHMVEPINDTFSFQGNVFQYFTPPASGFYEIKARGAQGGNAKGHAGGKGAHMQGRFALRAGQTYAIAVGGMGESVDPSTPDSDPLSLSGAGGGGGTSVVLVQQDSKTPIVFAGGGGGASRNSDGLGGVVGPDPYGFGSPGSSSAIARSFRPKDTAVNRGGPIGLGAPKAYLNVGGGGYYTDHGGDRSGVMVEYLVRGGETPSGIKTWKAQGGQSYVNGNFGGNPTPFTLNYPEYFYGPDSTVSLAFNGRKGGWGGGGQGIQNIIPHYNDRDFDKSKFGRMFFVGKVLEKPWFGEANNAYTGFKEASPFTRLPLGAKYLYYADDLREAGLPANMPITSLSLMLGMDFLEPGDKTRTIRDGLIIKLKNTNATSISGQDSSGGWTEVYNNTAPYSVLWDGYGSKSLETFSFNTPFVWDGVSNIIVDFHKDGPQTKMITIGSNGINPDTIPVFLYMGWPCDSTVGIRRGYTYWYERQINDGWEVHYRQGDEPTRYRPHVFFNVDRSTAGLGYRQAPAVMGEAAQVPALLPPCNGIILSQSASDTTITQYWQIAGGGGGGGGYSGGAPGAFSLLGPSGVCDPLLTEHPYGPINSTTIFNRYFASGGGGGGSYSAALAQRSDTSGVNSGNGLLTIKGPFTLNQIVNAAGPSYYWPTSGRTYTQPGTWLYVDINTGVVHTLSLSFSASANCTRFTNIDTTVVVSGSYTWYRTGRTYIDNTVDSVRIGCNNYILHVTTSSPSTSTANASGTPTGGSARTIQIAGPSEGGLLKTTLGYDPSESKYLACRNSTATFTLAEVPFATSYKWLLPAGVTGTSNSNSISVSFTNSFRGGDICVAPVNPIGDGDTICMRLGASLAPPTGRLVLSKKPELPYFSGFYRVTPIPGATQYTWSVSNGEMMILDGQGTREINIEAIPEFTEADLTVVASNCMGSSARATFKIENITRSNNGGGNGARTAARNAMASKQDPANMPCHSGDEILEVNAGAATDNRRRTYMINPVLNATKYKWSLPAGVTGSSTTNSITVQFGSGFNGGDLCVTPANDCVDGDPICKSISIQSTVETGHLEINGSAVPGGYENYTCTTVDDAGYYAWSVSNNQAEIVSGQGSEGIQLKTLPGFSLANLSVIASNCDGNLASGSLRLQKAGATDAGEQIPMSINVFPNPSKSNFNLQVNGNDTREVNIRIMDIHGRTINSMLMQPGQTKAFGNELKPGVYVIEARQGVELKRERVVKN